MHITFRQLQVFLAVAKTQNLSEAALDLSMSKSAVSQSLSDLESQLGVDLFERVKGKLLLASEGRRLIPHAQELLERNRDIKNLFSDTAQGQLKVAVTQSIGNFLLVDLLDDFNRHAGWMPTITMANTEKVSEDLINFSTDLGLIEGPVNNPDLHTEPWITDEMVVIASSQHPLAHQEVSWETLSNEAWILREKGSSTRNFFNTQIGQYLHNKNIVAQINSTQIILFMLMKGMGISYMTSRVLSDPVYGPYIAQIHCPNRFKRQLAFCLHNKKYLSGDLRVFMNFCHQWAKHIK